MDTAQRWIHRQIILWNDFRYLNSPNAAAHLLPEAAAERTLEAVRCSARLCENAMFW
jgi:hypothetical protein